MQWSFIVPVCQIWFVSSSCLLFFSASPIFLFLAYTLSDTLVYLGIIEFCINVMKKRMPIKTHESFCVQQEVHCKT